MKMPLFARVFAGRVRPQQAAEAPLPVEAPAESAPEPAGSLAGRCYRQGGEMFTVLKDGTNALIRSDRNAIPWYEPRAIVLQALARYGLEKPACSGSGFWYDAARVPLEEHLAIQHKKPPGSVKHWVGL